MTDRICVAVARETVDQALVAVRKVSSLADVIEIRLDYLKDIQVSPFLAAITTPLLFTNRPVWEGGRFSGDEDARLAPLVEAVNKQAAYVDLELRAPADSLHYLREEIEQSSTRLILSWHDFERTPEKMELVTVLNAMQGQGAHIGKIVTMAHDFHDVLRVLQLQEEAALMHFPLIAFCMGRPGVISRLATLELGGYMTYGSANNDEATAPGQLSVEVLRQIYDRIRQ
jgi:3-dehydroquinate dehydratase-1/3-dehydroquinate dehydratase/shikimate dehydrogenase